MKKTSGSPRYSLASLDSAKLAAFTTAIKNHIGIIPNGRNPSLNIGPCQYRIKIILREFYERRAIVNGKKNVSRSPKDTINRLIDVEKKTMNLVRELADISMHDPDTDEAIFYAIENIGNVSRSGMHYPNNHRIIDHLRFFGFAIRRALSDINKFKDQDKKLYQWPCYTTPTQHLIMSLGGLYHTQKGDSEHPPWRTARNACRVVSRSDPKEYAGPFLDLILDCFEALDIEDGLPSEDSYSNRNLGDLIMRALDNWEKIHSNMLNSLE